MQRNIVQQMIDILRACSYKQIITHVMYKTGLNCTVLKRNLELLVKQELIKTVIGSHNPNRIMNGNVKIRGESTTKTFYKTTDKGYKVIDSYYELMINLGVNEK